jgi:hypothetical protein
VFQQRIVNGFTMANHNLMLVNGEKKKTLHNQTINFTFTPILGSSPRTQTAYLNGKIKVSSTIYAEITNSSGNYKYNIKNPKATLTIDDWQTIKNELLELKYDYRILCLGTSGALTPTDLEPLKNGDTVVIFNMPLSGSANGSLTATLDFTF